jgi:hypothetical protein
MLQALQTGGVLNVRRMGAWRSTVPQMDIFEQAVGRPKKERMKIMFIGKNDRTRKQAQRKDY